MTLLIITYIVFYVKSREISAKNLSWVWRCFNWRTFLQIIWGRRQTHRKRAKRSLVLATHSKYYTSHNTGQWLAGCWLRPPLHLHAVARHARLRGIGSVHAGRGAVHHCTGTGRQHQLWLICNSTCTRPSQSTAAIIHESKPPDRKVLFRLFTTCTEWRKTRSLGQLSIKKVPLYSYSFAGNFSKCWPFSKLFHRENQPKICNKIITKDHTTP